MIKQAIRDVLILCLIGVAFWGLTRIRLHSRQTEKNRGRVVYTTTIDNAMAYRLRDSLEQVGFLNGVPRTYQLDRVDDVVELKVVADEKLLENPQVEAALHQGFTEVCRQSLAGERVSVILTNIDLTPFRVLIERESF